MYNTRLFAENHGAAISVETREQAGTTFHLWFAQADLSEERQPQADPAPLTRHTLLVAGPPGEPRDRMVEMLRTNGFYVVAAAPKSDALQALYSTDYHFSGVLMLCQRPDAEELSLFKRIQAEKLPVKLFLGLLSCNQDEIETDLLQRVDATFLADLPAQEVVSRIRAVLGRP